MAKESKGLLSGGLFAKPIMNSRVKTRAVSKKEKFLGHLLGPLGLIFVVNTIAALVEKFFTQQVGAMYGTGNVEMIQKMGGYYEAIMTVTKVLGVGLGLLIGFLLSRTKSKQGRFRPWYLIFGFMSIIVGALIFLFPGTTLGESYWYYFFFMLICYNTVGSSFSTRSEIILCRYPREIRKKRHSSRLFVRCLGRLSRVFLSECLLVPLCYPSGLKKILAATRYY